LILLFRFEAAPAPLALSGLVFPGIGTAGFVADNIVDNHHVTGVTRHGSVFQALNSYRFLLNFQHVPEELERFRVILVLFKQFLYLGLAIIAGFDVSGIRLRIIRVIVGDNYRFLV
jgi:hypothetical protein